MLRAIRLVACAVTLAIAPIVSPGVEATPVVLAGHESGSLFYGSPSSQGFDFTPVTNVNLTALGLWDLELNGIFPAYGPVGIWETSTELLLASAVVTRASPLDTNVIVEGGAWRYESLAAPLALSAGTTYTLGFLVASVVDPSESLILNFPTMVVNPAVIVPDRARTTSLTPTLEFPALIFGPVGNSMRSMVNAQLDTPVTEPASLIIVGTGLVALVCGRRRRRPA